MMKKCVWILALAAVPAFAQGSPQGAAGTAESKGAAGPDRSATAGDPFQPSARTRMEEAARAGSEAQAPAKKSKSGKKQRAGVAERSSRVSREEDPPQGYGSRDNPAQTWDQGQTAGDSPANMGDPIRQGTEIRGSQGSGEAPSGAYGPGPASGGDTGR